MPRFKDTTSRRDSKGRILKKGFGERKDGRYIFRMSYEGVRCKPLYDMDLRRLEKRAEEMKRNLDNGIAVNSYNMTLNQWFRKYIEYRRLTGLGEVGIRQMEDYYNWYIRDTPIGTRKLCHLDKLELLKHYKALQERKDHPLSYGTVKRVSNIVENALEEALAQRIITCNVAYKITKDIPEIIARKDREAVPEEDVRRFLGYAKNHRHYCYHYNVLVLLFGLGLRAGELCALTEEDMKEDHVLIYKSLQYRGLEGKRESFIGTTKTGAGVRSLPYPDCVKQAVERQRAFNRNNPHRCQTVVPVKYTGGKTKLKESYRDFFFYTSSGTPYRPDYLADVIKKIVKAFNRDEKKKALEEKREAKEISLFTSHYCRHTFATRAAENGVEERQISKWLGHALNEGSRVTKIYIHENWEDGYKELEKDLEKLNQIRLSSVA